MERTTAHGQALWLPGGRVTGDDYRLVCSRGSAYTPVAVVLKNTITHNPGAGWGTSSYRVVA